jgi:hypothetical protein
MMIQEKIFLDNDTNDYGVFMILIEVMMILTMIDVMIILMIMIIEVMLIIMLMFMI